MYKNKHRGKRVKNSLQDMLFLHWYKTIGLLLREENVKGEMVVEYGNVDGKAYSRQHHGVLENVRQDHHTCHRLTLLNRATEDIFK